MKAIIIKAYGGSENLMFQDNIEPPTCHANQVKVEVRAAAVNPLDYRIRNGELRFLLQSKLPLIVGNDLSGIVTEVGADIDQFNVGDEVFGMMDSNTTPAWHGFAHSGAYAELAVTRADTLCRKPANISHIEAAAVPLAALTAYQSLIKQANIQAGQKVLINGASGGVGTFAVQIAKIAGAHVTSVASAKNQALLEELGSDVFIDYRSDDFTHGTETYDVIYDVAANRSYRQCRHRLKPNGVYITNLPSAPYLIASLLKPLFRAVGKKLPFQYAWVSASGADLSVIAGWLASNKLKPVIGEVYPLQDAGKAHQEIQQAHKPGKIVLDMSELQHYPTNA